jgi:formylglycine-generating enzyme required for sulfatase activity
MNSSAPPRRLLLLAFLFTAAFTIPLHRGKTAPGPGVFMEMVKVPAGYSVGKYEVTQEQYEAVMGKNPSSFRGPRKPVENVSWEDAVKFCKRLTDMEAKAGRLPAGMVYSLPTEKQWEYYVDGATLADAVTSATKRRTSTEDVGSLRPNKFGLYDVRGNVWEWCLDPIEQDSYARVIRGGAFANSEPDKLAVDCRVGLTPLFKIAGVGFRCVLEHQ